MNGQCPYCVLNNKKNIERKKLLDKILFDKLPKELINLVNKYLLERRTMCDYFFIDAFL